jgi:Multiubiquitin
MTTETLQNDAPQIKAEVTITIDNKRFTVHRGTKSVAELKQLAGIPLAYELEEIVDGKLVPLRDDEHVVIKGGERFVSHPRAGASS